MKWFWKVRIHNTHGMYWHGQIEIDTIADFYFALTGSRMSLEGMSDKPWPATSLIGEAFAGLWDSKPQRIL